MSEIYSFISYGSIRYAKRELKLIREAIKKLKKAQFLGRRFELNDTEFCRELIFRNYRIVYDIEHTQIVILSVHHHTRLISNNPAFRNDE